LSSDRAKHWAWKQRDVSGAQLLLLLAMADNVGESLICYAAIATLQEMSRQSDRTIRRHLDELEALGKIRGETRPGRTTRYQLLVPESFGAENQDVARAARGTPVKMAGVDSEAPAEPGAAPPGQIASGDPGQNDRTPPRSDCQPPRSNWPDTPVKMTDDSSLNPSLPNPSQTRARASSSTSSTARTSARETRDDELQRLDARAEALQIPARRTSESLGTFRLRVRLADEASAELFKLCNTARNLGLSPKLDTESLEHFRKRIDDAHAAQLAAKAQELHERDPHGRRH
jgi:hypothetical protein